MPAKDMVTKDSVTDRASLDLLYDISREFAAALDLRTVLHRVLMLSMKTVAAVSGSIIVLDDMGQPIDSAFLLRSQPIDQNTLRLRLTYEHGLSGWVGRHRQAVLIDDTSKDERWYQRPDDAADRTGPKSAVSAPILAREKLVGVITLVHPEPGFFKQHHLELFQAIADQAGIAILNGRLYAESQRQAQVMTAVAESAAVINALLNLDEVLQHILEQVVQALGVQGTFLALFDPRKNHLEVQAAIPRGDSGIIGFRIPFGEGIAGWVFQENQGAIVHDARQDTRFVEEVDEIFGFESRTVLAAPIRSEGQVIGVLEVVNPKESSFEPDDLLVLMGIGSLAGTAIRRAELYGSLQAAHKRYQELFEDSIDPILITNWQGEIIEFNRQAQMTFGLRAIAPDSKEQNLLRIDQLHVVDWAKVGQNFRQLLTGQTISYESILQVQPSEQVPVEVYVRNILREGGASQLQWIMRDISERKDLDRLREDMATMIYHDLRSPLANIISSLEMLSAQLTSSDTPLSMSSSSQDSMLNIALRSTERIQRLTDSLLDINRLEAGQAISGLQYTRLDGLVSEAIEVILPAVSTKEIELLVNVPTGLPGIVVDADMIRRVVINLLENALKFTPPKGKISVQAQERAGFIQISVIDSGPGIPAEEKERIFNKYARLNVDTSPRGLGLGLAFCRLAITRHGGQIWVESELGHGSNFSFTLPVANQA